MIHDDDQEERSPSLVPINLHPYRALFLCDHTTSRVIFRLYSSTDSSVFLLHFVSFKHRISWYCFAVIQCISGIRLLSSSRFDKPFRDNRIRSGESRWSRAMPTKLRVCPFSSRLSNTYGASDVFRLLSSSFRQKIQQVH